MGDGIITYDGAKSDGIRTDGTGNENDIIRNDIYRKTTGWGSYMNKEALLRIESSSDVL